MATTINEGQHPGEFLVSEANGYRSRATVTIASGQDLKAGHVLGKLSATSISGSADSDNTGDGTIGSLSINSGAVNGDYRAVVTEPATDAGTFNVYDPNGVFIDDGTVGSAFSGGGVDFTISDGGTDFVAGDAFTITVSGSGEHKEYDPSNTDGSDTAVAVLYDNVDATGGAVDAAAIVRDAEVSSGDLIWFDSATDAQKTTGKDELQSNGGIVAR